MPSKPQTRVVVLPDRPDMNIKYLFNTFRSVTVPLDLKPDPVEVPSVNRISTTPLYVTDLETPEAISLVCRSARSLGPSD